MFKNIDIYKTFVWESLSNAQKPGTTRKKILIDLIT